MNYDNYTVLVPYPKRPVKPILSNKATPAEAREYANILEEYESEMAIYKSEMDKYQTEGRRLNVKFKEDAIEEAGLKGHPKADKAYSLAWEDGHSSGYSEVFNYLLKYADLVLD